MQDQTNNKTAQPDVLPEDGGEIREQVILPWSIAFRITLRGLRIRFGRSLITLSGVVLGIAFLMSVLTSEALKAGLAAENQARREVTRLIKLVEDEIGTFQGRTISVLISGPVRDEHRVRMLQRMAAHADPGAIRVMATRPDRLEAQSLPDQPLFRLPAFKPCSNIDDLVKDSHLLILLHEDLPLIPDADLVKLLRKMRQPVVLDYFHGRYHEDALRKIDPQISYSSLSYRMSEEERRRAEKRAAQARARKIWIVVVSVLVTVIGISNAMLMSVTERFREIGTMKCLGALSEFVVKLFLIESLIIGAGGAVLGMLLGFLTPFIAYMLSSGIALVLRSMPVLEITTYGVASVFAGTVLAIVAAIYPAFVAARMVPADALRTNV